MELLRSPDRLVAQRVVLPVAFGAVVGAAACETRRKRQEPTADRHGLLSLGVRGSDGEGPGRRRKLGTLAADDHVAGRDRELDDRWGDVAAGVAVGDVEHDGAGAQGGEAGCRSDAELAESGQQGQQEDGDCGEFERADRGPTRFAETALFDSVRQKFLEEVRSRARRDGLTPMSRSCRSHGVRGASYVSGMRSLTVRATLDSLIAVDHPCVLCRSPARGLCRVCADRLDPPNALAPPGVDRLHALAGYDGSGRDLVREIKLRGRRAPLVPLARALTSGIHVEPDLIVPIPSSRSGRRTRGWDPPAHLAALIARNLSTRPAVRQVLVRRDRRSQHGTGRDERLRGPKLSVRPRSRMPAHVLIVDDVMTTGATLTRAAEQIRAAGAQTVDALVIATV